MSACSDTLRTITPALSHALLGDSPAVSALRVEIDGAARCDAKVLLTGETGAGKEVVARADPRAQPQGRRAVPDAQLRRGSGLAARVRVVRTRARQFHRRVPRSSRAAAPGRRRHAVSRRGGRDEPADAGGVSALSRDRRVADGRRQREPHQCQRPDHRRHQSGAARVGDRRRVSRRPLLPAQRLSHPDSAAARAARGCPAPAEPLCRAVRGARRPRRAGVRRRDREDPREVPVAWQRARAPQRRRAGGVARRDAGDRARAPAQGTDCRGGEARGGEPGGRFAPRDGAAQSSSG